MLKGYSAQLAKRKAPPAAENTEASKGALIPRATVIVTANSRSKTPLKKAVVRVRTRRPSRWQRTRHHLAHMPQRHCQSVGRPLKTHDQVSKAGRSGVSVLPFRRP